MKRFGWDMNHINERRAYYKNLIEITEDKVLKEKYAELYNMYSALIVEKLFSEGEVINSGIPNAESIKEIKMVPLANEYSIEVLRIKNSIIGKMQSLEMNLPYVQFKRSMNGEKIIKLTGEAIHDIFGDVAYKDYKSIAIDSNSKIQIGNTESRACTHCVNDPECPDYYIYLPKCNNISLVNKLSHEAGHHHRLVVNHSEILENHILREYESFSYEIRVLDYFIKYGIYKGEAIKSMIRLINMLDAFASLFNELDLLESETVEEFTRKAHKRDLYNRLHIPNNVSLLDHLYTVKSEYVFPYIYSALCVFEEMHKNDSMEKYGTVIHKVGKIPEMELVKRIVPDDMNNLNGYREYRKEIRKLYKGE